MESFKADEGQEIGGRFSLCHVTLFVIYDLQIGSVANCHTKIDPHPFTMHSKHSGDKHGGVGVPPVSPRDRSVKQSKTFLISHVTLVVVDKLTNIVLLRCSEPRAGGQHKQAPQEIRMAFIVEPSGNACETAENNSSFWLIRAYGRGL